MANAHKVEMARTAVQLHVAREGLQPRGLPTSIHFVRIAPRRMDSDNHVSAWKAGRDGLCRALGFDDRILVIAEPRPCVQCTFE